MRNLKTIFALIILLSITTIKVKANIKEAPVSTSELTMTDEESLLYILEEEKLARDVYVEMFALWGENRFNNISNSEQTHMNTVEELLIEYEIAYEILPTGTFSNTDLQELYNQLLSLGQNSLIDAYTVGMTVEDVDIYDLQLRIEETSNESMIAAYSFLMCGSFNHMRAFNSGLLVSGGTYSPQFITESEYEDILSGSNAGCVMSIDETANTNIALLSSTLVHESFTVLLQGETDIVIYNQSGHIVMKTRVVENNEVNVSSFNTGVYFVKLTNANTSYVKKILKI